MPEERVIVVAPAAPIPWWLLLALGILIILLLPYALYTVEICTGPLSCLQEAYRPYYSKNYEPPPPGTERFPLMIATIPFIITYLVLQCAVLWQ